MNVARARARAHQAASSNPAPPPLFALHPRTLTHLSSAPGAYHRLYRMMRELSELLAADTAARMIDASRNA